MLPRRWGSRSYMLALICIGNPFPPLRSRDKNQDKDDRLMLRDIGATHALTHPYGSVAAILHLDCRLGRLIPCPAQCPLDWIWLKWAPTYLM